MDPIALYIHWPFCLAKCPYCDFNSHVRAELPQQRFRAALSRELAYEAARVGRRRLISIFFGGGTPSLMAPETVACLIAEAKSYFIPAEDLEVTLEANPTSAERGRFAAFREAGVNRLSLGVQSLNEEALRFLGRQHNVAEALAAMELGRTLFPRFSFDLIYARPGQTLAAWRAELTEALGLTADHISLYQLTIEPGTVFAKAHRSGAFRLPEPEEAVAFYETTGEIAAAFGLEAYEVSNYARPGAESRHNLAYWRYHDYIGIGPGAHGRLSLPEGRIATLRQRSPEIWLERVERDGHANLEEAALSPLESAREMMLMGLRLREGVNIERLAQRTGVSLGEVVDGEVLRTAVAEGYLEWEGTHLRAKDAGRLRLDALLAALLV